MKLLLDTHILLWAADHPERLSPPASALITDPRNDLFFSSLSIWEVAIKGTSRRTDFLFDAGELRLSLVANGFAELPMNSDHAIATSDLPALHKDPFDRLLIAQAVVEDMLLITVDEQIARYSGPIRKV